MRISKPTVGHGSTKFFRRAEIFAHILFCKHYSEPEAARLSSVEDVTATSAVQWVVRDCEEAVELRSDRRAESLP